MAVSFYSRYTYQGLGCWVPSYVCNRSSSNLQSEFRRIMRNVPLPVVVVTAGKQTNGRSLKRGLTCSSFTSISMNPPLVSFAIAQHSRMHALLSDVRHFAVNVLTTRQVALGVHFARPAQNGCQFTDIPHDVTEHHVPTLRGASAVLHCGGHSSAAVGDHHVWYGRVLRAERAEPQAAPLLYYSRGFRGIGDEIFLQAFEDRSLPFENWTHEAHIRMAWNYIKEFGYKDAIPKIRDGIQRYNDVNKDKIRRGYNETVTMFYIHMVQLAMQQAGQADDTFEQFIIREHHLLEGDLLFRFYSPEIVSHNDAVTSFLQPDLQPLPPLNSS